eukprot:g6496.t1
MNRAAVMAERRAANLAQNYGRAINLSAGCAVLPLPVLKEAQKQFVDTRSSGVSIAEMGYRTRNFYREMEEAEASFRKLLAVPDSYEVHFFNGGATLQFAAIPMNLLGVKNQPEDDKKKSTTAVDVEDPSVNYVMNGHWSEKARNEARLFTTRVNEVTKCPLGKDLFFSLSDEESDWKFDERAVYTHYTAADTRQGFEFQEFPYHFVPQNQILCCDASANLGSKPVDVAKYGVLYAAAHKNFSTSGCCYTIIRRDLIDAERLLPNTPTMCNWSKFQAAEGKVYNVPVIFAIWLGKLTTNWMLEQGGLTFFEDLAIRRSRLLYDFIDHECDGFYKTFVSDPKFRSRMNIVFTIAPPENEKNPAKNVALVDQFLRETGDELGWLDIRSHPLGIDSDAIRVTTYNAQTIEAVSIVRDFMKEFWERHR